MNKLEYQIHQVLKKDRQGSFGTQAGRQRTLFLCVKQLQEAGYKVKKMKPEDLKGRHINALLKRWQDDGVSVGTIKNRLANLRWLADKIGNKGLVKSNDELGIGKRQYITNKDKGADITKVDMTQLSPNVSYSVRLQEHFGLRREEAMKFQLDYALDGYPADKVEIIKIKPSWAKGGRYREIPITSKEQINLLGELEGFFKAHNLHSLIPNERSYKEHMKHFENETRAAGIGRTHGLRHLYAQRRYKDLIGFECPVIDNSRVLTEDEKQKDRQVRMLISEELGHGRISVTGIYLGSWSLKK